VPDLGSFQRDFARALLDASGTATALRVHRNTVMKGLVDALAANYPTVVELVGADWFKACALEYIRVHPARSPVLALYGEAFPAFLAAFAPAAELPYLADVARIDRMWIEAHTAADAVALTPGSLARLTPSTLAERRMRLHPAARFASVRHSAATIWIHHRAARADDTLTIAEAEEAILLTRPHGRVEYALLDGAAITFLNSLHAGASLGTAAAAALEADATTDIAGVLARSLAAGAFTHSREIHS
jgi:hypothetical protein